jgi:hypothetical protein
MRLLLLLAETAAAAAAAAAVPAPGKRCPLPSLVPLVLDRRLL